MTRLTLEELRKAEAIYTEHASSYAKDNFHIYHAHLMRVAESAHDGYSAAPRDYIALDTLYRRYADCMSMMLPVFTIALNELEEAQRLLKLTEKALEDAEWGGMEAPPGLSQFDDRTTCPVCCAPSGDVHADECSLGIALKELYPERRQSLELGVDTEARDG